MEGTIEVLEHRLTIAATGRVRAGVNARDIEIWGCIEGQLEAANQVHIRKGARFVGELHAAGLVIEEGGYIKGSIDLSRHPGSSMDSHRNISKVEPIRQLSEAVLTSTSQTSIGNPRLIARWHLPSMSSAGLVASGVFNR